MKINVVMLVKCFTLDVALSDTVKSVKEKIKETQGIAVDEQRLVFDQKELKDDGALLGDLGIKEWSPIFEFTHAVAGDT